MVAEGLHFVRGNLASVYRMLIRVFLYSGTMEVASADDVASVEVLVPIGRGLDVQFSFLYLYVARRCLHKGLSNLAKRGVNVKSESEGSSRGGPSAPW